MSWWDLVPLGIVKWYGHHYGKVWVIVDSMEKDIPIPVRLVGGALIRAHTKVTQL